MESAHHFSSRPDCIGTAEVLSFILRTALSAIPFVSDRWGVEVRWVHDRSSKDLPNFNDLSVWMTFGFSDGSKNFRALFFRVLRNFVLHGYDWIHWAAKSCTTIEYRWLRLDSLPSLRTLWSAVIKTPNFCARGAECPVPVLQGALVILFRLQTLQFWSFRKWV